MLAEAADTMDLDALSFIGLAPIGKWLDGRRLGTVELEAQMALVAERPVLRPAAPAQQHRRIVGNLITCCPRQGLILCGDHNPLWDDGQVAGDLIRAVRRHDDLGLSPLHLTSS